MTALPAATLFGTQVHKLTSTQHGEEYKLSLWLPPSYTTASTSYPVVYVLDAEICFGMAVNTTLPLIWGREVPEVILAGIGYYHQGFEDIGGARERDFTPRALDDVAGSGGASIFLSFLETELIPFVDAYYRTIPDDRSIWGASLGGLFVLYCFFERPHLFHRYIGSSPALSRNLPYFLNRIETLSSTPRGEVRKLFVSVGSDETPGYLSSLDAFTQALLRRKDASLHLQSVTLDKETHVSQISRAYVTGLRAVFA